MRLGLCTGFDGLDAARKAGFDYIEPPVAALVPDKPDADFAAVVAAAKKAAIKPEAFNCFIPASLKITGPDANLKALADYVAIAAARAASIGGKVIVFGSGGARAVPQGFPADKAMDQVVQFLRAIAPIARKAGITVAIEPLRKAECNIINLVSQGYALARLVGAPAVLGLADLYHVGQENEPYADIAAGGRLLAHVHVAHPVTRKCPLPGDGFDYRPFLRALKQAGYDDRISLECGWDSLPEQGPEAAGHLRTQWNLS